MSMCVVIVSVVLAAQYRIALSMCTWITANVYLAAKLCTQHPLCMLHGIVHVFAFCVFVCTL